MKGLQFGSTLSWSCGQTMLAERNPHIYLQYLLMGPDADIECNLVVPTQWGLLYTPQRTTTFRQLWEQHLPPFGAAEMEVLEKQEQCLASCAVCALALPYDSRLPYQMALRLVADKDSYDVLLGMLCRKCETTAWYKLLRTTLDIYPALCLVLAKLAFAEPVSGQYLERIDRLNDQIPTVLATTQGLRCVHCGALRKSEALKGCPGGCPSVSFCGDAHCIEMADCYHRYGICTALKEYHLFHSLEATIVDITGQPYGIYSAPADAPLL
jgi:hypothetical protein